MQNNYEKMQNIKKETTKKYKKYKQTSNNNKDTQNHKYNWSNFKEIQHDNKQSNRNETHHVQRNTQTVVKDRKSITERAFFIKGWRD